MFSSNSERKHRNGGLGMDTWKISGGESLFGSVRIPGAKNSVLPLMAASLLCNGTVTLSDVPNLSDAVSYTHLTGHCQSRIDMTGGSAGSDQDFHKKPPLKTASAPMPKYTWTLCLFLFHCSASDEICQVFLPLPSLDTLSTTPISPSSISNDVPP